MSLIHSIFKVISLIVLLVIGGQSFAIDTNHGGLPDDGALANGRNPLAAVYQVSLGGNHTCALNDTGVVCWGINNSSQTDAPALSNPTQVSLGGNHTCALDDKGVVCWGRNHNGQTDVPALSNPTQVSPGTFHTCALDDSGVVCWGDNDNGQTDVPVLSNPTQVSLGGNHTCALDDTGVACWGYNMHGQTDVPALRNPTQVSLGGNHSCALDDTGVVCWGDNGNSQIDVPALSNPTQVSLGYNHTCALNDTGVVCWGYNGNGRTRVPTEFVDTDADGIFDATDAYPLISLNGLTDTDADGRPDLCDSDCMALGMTADDDDDNDGILDSDTVISGVDLFQADRIIYAGYRHACSKFGDEISCWGTVEYGNGEIPELVNPVGFDLTHHHTCAIDEGTAVCWGRNGYGQAAPPLISDVQQVSAGLWHSCAIANNELTCWGRADTGLLDIPAVVVNPEYVAAGYKQTCVIEDEDVICWGADDYNVPTVPMIQSPRQISAGEYFMCASSVDSVTCWGSDWDNITATPSVTGVRQLASGSYHACVLSDGGVDCWGKNNYGQTDVPELLNPVQVSSGGYHSCALEDRGIVCWGRTEFIQSVPTEFVDTDADGIFDATDAYPLISLNGLTDTDADGRPDLCDSDCMALGMTADDDDDNDDVLDAVDDYPLDNRYSRDTDGDGLLDSTEFEIGTDPLSIDTDRDSLSDKFEVDSNSRNPIEADYSLASGDRHSCISQDQGIQCWGYDSGSNLDAPADLIEKVNLEMGNYFSCALKKLTGEIICWGENYNNLELSGANFEQIAAGGYHTCGLRNGSVICGGADDYGQSSPPEIINALKVTAGGQHSCALTDSSVFCWGRNNEGQTDVPQLENPTKLFSGARNNCVLDDQGWKCWGIDYSDVTVVPDISTASDISIGRSHACALHENGVQCWGDNFRDMSDPPPLINPVQLGLGTFHSCSLSDEGVSCWGSSDDLQLIIPENLRFGDFDNDGLLDDLDSDDDNDNYADVIDAFPLDATESTDTDSDGTGNNTDTDDDGDTISDADEVTSGTDSLLADTDGDGVDDNLDAFALDAKETVDTDRDLTGNNADLDDDGDSISDIEEIQNGTNPLLADSDGDGVNDNLDEFPLEQSETVDTDGDLIGNNADADDDNDGILDTEDDFPLDARYSQDTDSDGMPNAYEDVNGLNKYLASDSASDTDGDGLTALQEFEYGTSPSKKDSDSDTLPDGWEVENGRDPSVADYQVSLGGDNTCALDDTGVVCWGFNGYGQTNVPALSDPKQVSGGSHTCALDDSGVVCWGRNDYSQTNVPALSDPKQVSVGSVHTCALDNSGVVCWGKNLYGQTNVPALSNPTQVLLGSSHTCALDDTGVVCWGRNERGQTDVPTLSNPTQVSLGTRYTCALDDTGVVCWGKNNFGQTDVPALSNPTQVSLGYYHICALDDTGVVCWGNNVDGLTDIPANGQIDAPTGVPALSDPKQVSVGAGHTCALDNTGVVCWGYKTLGATDVPALMIDPDGDGFNNQGDTDAFPLDLAASNDFDGDGLPDSWNAGRSQADSTSTPKLTLDLDDDNDGVADIDDLYPLNASESADSDGDLVGDNADAFPNDASETADTDEDGVGDNSDNCLNTSNSDQLDSDSDSSGNACDADDDNDGVADVNDALPLNPDEQIDTDGDLIGNNADSDDDNDNVPDTEDSYPLNSLYSADSDGDGMPDAWEIRFGLNPNDASDAGSDVDTDGAVALQEFIEGTVPSLPISGMAYHWRNHSMLESVQLNLVGIDSGIQTNFSDQTISDKDGSYAFSTAYAGTNHMTAIKAITAGELGSVISSADALAALKIAVGINPNTDPDGAGPEEALPVSPYQYIAADITGDGRVTSADALAILKMAVKLDSAEPRRWVFVAEDYDFWDEASESFKTTRTDVAWDSDGMIFDYPEKSVQNVVGVLMGDVNGNWAEPEGSETVTENYFSDLAASQGGSIGQWGLVNTDSSILLPHSPEINIWTPGVYETIGSLENICENPRSNDIYQDQFGNVSDENNWIRSWTNDSYLWYDELPDIDPASVDNTSDYFYMMRTSEISSSGREKDPIYQRYMIDTEEARNYDEGGDSVGYGMHVLRYNPLESRRIFVAYTQPQSPASNAGISRGDEIIAINGELVTGGNQFLVESALAPTILGEEHVFRVRNSVDGEVKNIIIRSAEIEQKPVLTSNVFHFYRSSKIGYILFNDHSRAAERALIDSVSNLKADNIEELVLDLRYNQGGYGYIAAQLGYMIAGEVSNGQTFFKQIFNDKYNVRDPVYGNEILPTPFLSTTVGDEAITGLEMGTALPALDLDRVFIISDYSTCSSSELLINGLRGIGIEVILIGGTTCGKPYGGVLTDNCGTSYYMIQTTTENARGFGDYADGFEPTESFDIGDRAVKGCSVLDSFDGLLGSASENMLSVALHYIENGSCPYGTTPTDNIFTKRTKPSRRSLQPIPIKGRAIMNYSSQN